MRRKRWSRTLILREIRRRKKAGLPVTSGLVCRQANALYSIARYYFGSWPRAMKAAGIKVIPRAVWTRARLLKVIRSLREREGEQYLGSDSLEKESKRIGVDLQRLIRSHFGSLLGLQSALALPNRLTWSRDRAREKVLRDLREYVGKGRLRYGELYRTNRPLIRACRQAFGGWGKALDAVQFPLEERPLNRGPLKYTRERIITILARAWKTRDVRVDILRRRYSGVYIATIREFGSWKRGLAAAGVPAWVYATRMSASKAAHQNTRFPLKRLSSRR